MKTTIKEMAIQRIYQNFDTINNLQADEALRLFQSTITDSRTNTEAKSQSILLALLKKYPEFATTPLNIRYYNNIYPLQYLSQLYHTRLSRLTKLFKALLKNNADPNILDPKFRATPITNIQAELYTNQKFDEALYYFNLFKSYGTDFSIFMKDSAYKTELSNEVTFFDVFIDFSTPLLNDLSIKQTENIINQLIDLNIYYSVNPLYRFVDKLTYQYPNYLERYLEYFSRIYNLLGGYYTTQGFTHDMLRICDMLENV